MAPILAQMFHPDAFDGIATHGANRSPEPRIADNRPGALTTPFRDEEFTKEQHSDNYISCNFSNVIYCEINTNAQVGERIHHPPVAGE